MNWKEFKQIVELQGVTDDMKINYIDTDMHKPTVEIYSIDNSFHIE